MIVDTKSAAAVVLLVVSILIGFCSAFAGSVVATIVVSTGKDVVQGKR